MKWIVKLSKFDITIFYRLFLKMGPADSDPQDMVYATDLATAVYDLSIENS